MIFSCRFHRVCALPVPAEDNSSAGRALSPASVRSEPACSTATKIPRYVACQTDTQNIAKIYIPGHIPRYQDMLTARQIDKIYYQYHQLCIETYSHHLRTHLVTSWQPDMHRFYHWSSENSENNNVYHYVALHRFYHWSSESSENNNVFHCSSV